MKRRLKVDIVTGLPKMPAGKRALVQKGKKPGHLLFGVAFTFFGELPVESVEWQQADTRSAGKAAAGTVVGALTFGVLGAVVGAAFGGRKQDQSKAVIRFHDGSQLVVRCTASDFTVLQGYLQP